MIFAVVIGGLGTIEGPIIGAVDLLRAAATAVGLRHLVPDPDRGACRGRGGLRPAGLWGTIARKWPIDLFPVRRRLCLETVCLPEETPKASAEEPGGYSAGEFESPGEPRAD